MEVDTQFLVELSIALVTLAGGAVATYYKGVISMRKYIDNLEKLYNERVRAIEAKLDNNVMKIDIFWKIVEDKLPRMLMKPTHKRMDDLLAKVEKKTITLGEMKELRDILHGELEEDVRAKNSKSVADLLMISLLEFKIKQSENK